jgi:MFS transporter, FLVCR family, MFS-domain-containing protein 7
MCVYVCVCVCTGGSLSCLGAFIRVLGVVLKQYIGNTGAYSLVLLGQSVAALAQPMFNSLPVPLASHWFSVGERDIATAVSSLFSPLGNAFGQIFPPVFVTEDEDDDTGTGTVSGMRDLMLLEAGICLASFLLAYMFFESHPPTPASYSTQLKDEGVDVYCSQDSQDHSGGGGGRGGGGRGRGQEQSMTSGLERVKQQVCELLSNRDYVILLVAFSTGLGLFNTFLTLIYQIVEPYGYRY